MRALALVAIAFLIPAGLASAANRASFMLLDAEDSAYAISADAQVAVGIGPGAEAVLWTAGATGTGLGYLPGGTASTATAANIDGSVVVGWGTYLTTTAAGDFFNNRAFRWTLAGGMVELGMPPSGINATAEDVSADGWTVVGSVQTDCDYQAFRWTSDVGMALLDPVGCVASLAYGISADGSRIVGARYGGENPEAFLWTADGGMVGLGYLPADGASIYPGEENSVAQDISADGSVVVGISTAALDGPPYSRSREAFRWTAAGGMAGLGFLPGNSYSNAKAVSANGSVVVGWALGSAVPGGSYLSNQKAFIWTEEGGLRPLYDELLANGATGLDGWDLISAQGVSADGLWIVGQALSSLGQSQGFLAYIDPPDLTPDPFFFPAQVDVLRSSVVTSAPARITGITGAAPVWVDGGQYSVGCGAVYTSAPGTVSNGDVVCVRQTSAASGSTTTITTLTIGRVTATPVSATFWSTTAAVPDSGGGGALDGLSLLALGLVHKCALRARSKARVTAAGPKQETRRSSLPRAM
jgi:uncharacterized membrane protein